MVLICLQAPNFNLQKLVVIGTIFLSVQREPIMEAVYESYRVRVFIYYNVFLLGNFYYYYLQIVEYFLYLQGHIYNHTHWGLWTWVSAFIQTRSPRFLSLNRTRVSPPRDFSIMIHDSFESLANEFLWMRLRNTSHLRDRFHDSTHDLCTILNH